MHSTMSSLAFYSYYHHYKFSCSSVYSSSKMFFATLVKEYSFAEIFNINIVF